MRSETEHEGYLVYEAALAGLAQLRFPPTRSRQTHTEEVSYLLRPEHDTIDWSEGKVQLDADELERTAEADAFFDELPADLGAAKSLTALEKEFEDYLYYNSTITLWHNPHLDLYSKPDETYKAFYQRCREAAEEALDAEAEKLRSKYETKLDRLEAKLEREERELEEDKVEHDARKQEELLSGAESIFGLFTGRRSSSRISSASRRRRMTRQAKADVEESVEAIAELEEQMEELEEEAKEEVEELKEKWEQLVDEMEEIPVRPRRADVRVNLFALAWVPRWEVTVAGQALSMPAFEVERV